MTFRFEVEIDKPVDQVYKLFLDRSLFPKWQPGLVSDEKLEMKDGHTRHKLVYQMGKRKFLMTETILNTSPEKYELVYDMKGVKNIISNRFKDNKGKTLWAMETTFKFRWLMKLISVFMRRGFEQQSVLIMKNFKGFAEHHL